MEKIYLIGFMGTGKTNAGLVLSKILKYDFLDMDEIIEGRERMSIKDIFSKLGEDYFRIRERDLLFEISNKQNVVVSTGGGTPCFFDNIEIMKKTGFVVYLSLNEFEILNRLKENDEKNKRPLLNGRQEKDILLLLKDREKFYSKAHYIIDCSNKTVDSISKEIKVEYEKWIKKQ